MKINPLQADFNEKVNIATKLKIVLIEKLENLFSTNHVSLGVPMESRVKAWSSIANNIEQNSLSLKKIEDLNDFVGIRVILLFRPDIARVDQLLRSMLDIVSVEDTAHRLSENQFGYQSQHYIVKIPHRWLGIPSLRQLETLKAEIQIRTLAQHIWAAASHKLQYKNENSIPFPLRRSMHRLSALLELVDFEFERILDERSKCLSNEIVNFDPMEPLNVDIVQSIFAELLPPVNRLENENYADLLSDLTHFGVKTANELRELLITNMEAAILEADEQYNLRSYHDDIEEKEEFYDDFSYAYLVRLVLCEKFGQDEVMDWLISKN